LQSITEFTYQSGIAIKFGIDGFLADNNCAYQGPSFSYSGVIAADDSALPSYFLIDANDGSINVDKSAPV
jgi:hypothetical protein